MKNSFINFLTQGLCNIQKRASVLKAALVLAGGLFFQTAQAQSPYCNAAHTAAGCPTYDMYIGAIKITQGANTIFDKTNDGCNQTTTPNYTLMSTSPVMTLNGGANYTFATHTGANYPINIGVWIDLNGDLDFNDADEWVSKGWASINNGVGSMQSRNFYISCTGIKGGTTRMRVRSDYGFSAAFTQASACATVNYGETEDYTIELGLPKSLAAGFFMPDTAFVKTPVSFVNSNQTGYIGHWWDVDDDASIEYTTTNAMHKFNSEGKFCVRLTSQNCLGRDSILKCLQIVKPSSPPVADFISDKNIVELYDGFKMTDLSTNGAIYWDWYLYDPADSANTYLDGNSLPQLSGGDETYNKNPEIFTAKGIPGFPDVGKYTFCLTASNDVGSSATKCKTNYVEVNRGNEFEMGPGTITSIPGNTITAPSGAIINKVGAGGNYSTPESNLDALIAPCAASKVTLTFEYWTVQSNVNLKVYDGPNAAGKPLHTGAGFTSTNSPTAPLVSNSGAIYLLWNSTGTATAKGFKANWTSVIGTKTPPTARFNAPDTVYNAVENTFVNTSLNAVGEVDFTWLVDGVEEATTKDFPKTFYSNTTYNVCLEVRTCAGKDTYCKNIVVAAPNTPANLDFVADNRRPRAGDVVTFKITTDKANKYRWTFFPSTTTPATPLETFSKELKVTFNAPGKYTVSLKGWNTVDSANSLKSIIKDQYIVVVDYCKPVIGVTTSADVAISNVKLETTKSPSSVLFDIKDEANNTYTDHGEKNEPAVLTFGAQYKVTVDRLTNINNMTRKIWVDWNIDGDFSDANELVASESSTNSMSFSANFNVPDLDNSFEGVTKMRVGVSYNLDPNEPCGAISGVKDANRIGEFEDFPIKLVNDMMPPVLTLNNEDTLYLELKGTYTEYGATAIDPTQGDISSKVKIVSDVDMSLTGIYYVTYSVKDASGNAAPSVTRVVYVVIDQTAPTLTLQGTDTMYIEVFGTYTEPGFSASDSRDGNLNSAIVVVGTVNTNVVGTYVINYSVQDAQANKASKNRVVIVRDTESPVIKNNEIKVIGGVNVVQVQLQSVFVDRTEVTDNYYDVQMTATPGTEGEAFVDTRVKGSTVVTYNVIDGSGNSASLIIKYVIEDFVAPMINLNTLDTVMHLVNTPYVAVEANASDNLYDASQISLTKTSNVNPFVLGLYKDTYTATDASGNVSVRNRWVRVYDGKAPEIKGKTGDILRVGLYSVFASIDYLQFSDNYDNPTTLKNNASVINTDINTYVEGFYTATFKTKDNSGNISDPFTLWVEVSRKYLPIGIGVENITSDNLMNVYPNPNNGNFTIRLNLPSTENVSLEVYNMVGSKVMEVANGSLSNESFEVNMPESEGGVYFVRMTVNGTVINKKIVLTK